MRNRLELTGWALWFLGLGPFLISGIRNANPWTVSGTLLFGAGIVLFLIPAIGRRSR